MWGFGVLIVLTVLNKARVDHLGHEVRSNLARLMLLLQVHELLLKVVDHSKLGLDVRLLLRRSLLVGFDLSQGTSALRAHLQHVGGHALRN